MQGESVLVEQFEYVVNDLVLSFGEQVRLGEGRLRNAGARILTAKLGDDVVEVLLRSQARALQYLRNLGNPPYLADRRYSIDMVPRVAWSLFICLSVSTPAPACVPWHISPFLCQSTWKLNGLATTRGCSRLISVVEGSQ